jgi:hypothetical protein
VVLLLIAPMTWFCIHSIASDLVLHTPTASARRPRIRRTAPRRPSGASTPGGHIYIFITWCGIFTGLLLANHLVLHTEPRRLTWCCIHPQPAPGGPGAPELPLTGPLVPREWAVYLPPARCRRTGRFHAALQGVRWTVQGGEDDIGRGGVVGYGGRPRPYPTLPPRCEQDWLSGPVKTFFAEQRSIDLDVCVTKVYRALQKLRVAACMPLCVRNCEGLSFLRMCQL